MVTSGGPLRVAPLGGLGEIGLNCLLLECSGYAIAIDCGALFPDTSMLGIDLAIPDIEYLRDLGDRFLGFVITHGHEDHIGALAYVLRDSLAPIHATPMAAGLLTSRLREHGLDSKVDLTVFRPRQTWDMGPFHIDPIHMTHSIVDAVALAITTPYGVVIHTGDFKLDETPIDGRKADVEALAEYGDAGVLLLLSDSTNVEQEGRTRSECTVHDGLEKIFHDSKGKIFFSTFSSHIHRIQQVLELAEATGRSVVTVGRSLMTSMKIATDLGYLKAPLSLFAEVSDLNSLHAAEAVVLTSGSQGEPMSALTRISLNDHHQVKMVAGDTVVLSSRIIPGNERIISNMINHMMRRGAEVYHTRNASVHVSGHASEGELAQMIQLVRPKYFVPVHGEYRHLSSHVKLARSLGIAEDRAFLLENGQVLEIDSSGARMGTTIRAGRVFVDGKGIGDIGDIVLRDRRHLSRDGFLLVVLALDQHSGELVNPPEFISRGLFEEVEASRYYESAREVVLDTLGQLTVESRSDAQEVKEEVRKALRRYFSKMIGRSPVVLPFVMEM